MDEFEEKSCSCCFFTTKFPGITIGENGKCNFCNSGHFAEMQKQQTTGNLEALRRKAQELKDARTAKTGKYDCIIGASGGLDSSYVIYVAKKLLDLNPLVVKYDHGFNYDIANSNVQAICRDLGLDLKVVKSAHGFDRQCFKYRVLALKKLGSYWGVCKFCGYACFAAVYREALKYDVSTLLISNNLYELGDLEMSFKMKSMIKAFLKRNPLQWLQIAFHLAISQYYLLRLKMELYVPPIKNLFRRQPKPDKDALSSPIQWLNITDYVEWDIDHIVKTLESETGWRAPKLPRLPMRYDCIIEEGFVNHTRKQTAGTTIHAVISNRMIAAGLRTKENLKPTIEHYDKEIDIRIREMEKTLGLSSKKSRGCRRPLLDD